VYPAGERRRAWLSADTLKDANTQFLELAKVTFGEFQTATRGELEAREKTFTQMVERSASRWCRSTASSSASTTTAARRKAHSRSTGALRTPRF
jgi:hypothetical protein